MMLARTGAGFADGDSVLEARSISKSFSGLLANYSVDFSLRRGEIHALLGENGAGKSTLASVLTGLYHPDSGEVVVAGDPVRLRGPGDALRRRIGMVHQHFRLVESFTVAENVLLGDPHQPFFLSRRQIAMVAALGDRYQLRLDPQARVADLSMGERQRVEIVKMLYRNVDVLFLDEPTAVLVAEEVAALFRTLRAMTDDGKSIVLITHKLDEVLAIADCATVMRDGRVVGTTAVAETSASELARLMVGRDVVLAPRRLARQPGRAVLRAERLSVAGPDRPGAAIDLVVRAGEIVGVAGVAGNGQLQLAETLAGLRRPFSGTVLVDDVEIAGRGPRAARDAGLAYVPQDRLGTALAPRLSILDNIRLTKRLPFFVADGDAEAAARDAIDLYAIKARGPRDVTGRLSGGNVQKVLLARELGAGAAALVVASPTRGLDVAAIEFVRDLLDSQRAAGVGILLMSEDLDEIRDLADRIVVMHSGRFVLECDIADCDLTELGMAMAGRKGARQ
jgi:simple sugar transport system ATP-binding protein